MPKSTPVTFKRSLIAVAVLSVSACSTMPQVPNIDLSGVGSSIVKAGKATADVSRKTWNTTSYLLGFSDTRDGSEPAGPSDKELLLADGEIQQVLPDEEAPLPVPESTLLADAQIADDPTTQEVAGGDGTPVLVQQATAASAEPLRELDAAEVTDPTNETAMSIEEAAKSVASLTGDESTADNVLTEEAPIEDLIHEVADNENLWDIAKKTTGNANNWHVLADVNNLNQSAMVFPGQELIIPASMVKPDYDTLTAPVELAALKEAQDITDATRETLAEGVRLAIPSNTNAELVSNTPAAEITEQENAEDLIAAASENAEPIDLNDGETLWDFAKRTTGNALNWQAIADQNNFTEKQAVTVRPGQTIFVPQDLLRADTDTASSAIVTENPTQAEELAQSTPVAIEAATSVMDTAITEDILTPIALEPEQIAAAALPETASQVQDTLTENTESVIAELAEVDTTPPIEIVEATYKTDDSLTPVAIADESVPMVENDNIPARIVVSGTYYPKAVYNNADFSSSLLMRVSPGTTLQVSRAMGTWFEVETDKGVGFVHQRDIK
ncbi:MAG: LysM peptidoglycan-binding domain-containing protein [Granulosicoccus sp.]